MSNNPYVTQVSQQTGMSEWEVERTCRRTPPTIEQVKTLGFDTVEEYEESLHEFLNGL